ncbi:MAG: hypothetical protein NZL91_04265, partial [Thermoflexales bacterium]|nr:hypothetical protein [Thermoflexales bacterium]
EAWRGGGRGGWGVAVALRAPVPRLPVPPPQGGYYLFPRVLGCSAGEEEEKLVLDLLAHGVLVHPGYFYGCTRGAHLMISCLVQQDALVRGLALIRERLASAF